MNAATSFIPSSKGAGGDVLFHALRGAAKKGEFPIMNGSRAVCAEMSDPAKFHQAVHDASTAVFDKMSSVKQHDTRVAFMGCGDVTSAFTHGTHEVIRQNGRRCVRINEDLLNG